MFIYTVKHLYTGQQWTNKNGWFREVAGFVRLFCKEMFDRDLKN
jgi:hypothetical protein